MTPRRERKFEANISRGAPSSVRNNRTCGNGDYSCFGFRVSSFSVAFLVAMVLSGGWCSLWTSKCDGVVSASPVHRIYDISGPHISDSLLRTENNFRDYTSSNSKPNNLEDSPAEYSANNYLSSRSSSVLLKRSRRISRTSQSISPGNATKATTSRDARNPRRGHASTSVGGFSRTSKSFSKSLKSSRVQACSHVGDMTNDIAARAYLAGTIFEGKARSRSSVRNPGGMYFVTFQVQHVHKDHQNPGALRIRSQVRLQFREKVNSAVSGRCVQDYNYTTSGGKTLEPVRANIKRGGKYLVFVSGIGPHNFSVLGEPAFRTKKNLQAVRDVLCHNCVRPIGVWGLRDVSVKVKDKLRLVCRCKGNPLPAILWLKDGALINATRNSRIQYKKKRSSLLIPRVRPEDGGRYECRAISVTGESMASWATVTVTPLKTNTLTDNTTTLWPLFGGPCPIDTYCLNGGTCTYYETVGELVCQCAEGYKGQRCESKDVYNRSSMYRPMSYFCKLGISSSYYC